MQTVSRAIEVINYVSSGPKSLIEITKHLGTHKSTVLRLLQTLEKSKYAARTEDNKWGLGAQLIQIADSSINSLDIKKIARPYLTHLESTCGHTVHLAQLIGKDLVYIEKIEGSDSVKMYSRIGKSLPIHASAIGKVVYANLEEPKKSEIEKSLTFEKFTSTTIVDKNNFEKEIKKIQRRGWSLDNGEFESNMNCIAVAVLDQTKKIRMGISISTLKVIAPESKIKNYLPDLIKTANKISKKLGYTEDSRTAI